MDLGLANRVVVVVGGGSGIGRACVDGFVSEGCRVASWDIKHPSGMPETCQPIEVDIVSESQVAQALQKTNAELGPVDHVVHAAAVGSGKFGVPFTNLSPSDWQKVLEVNVNGMVNVAHAISVEMVPRRNGSFVFIASVAGQIGSPTDPPYSASKAANINFAQVMAKDLAPHNVRVNTVCPGMVKTPLNESVWRAWNEQQDPAGQKSYLKWAQDKIEQLVPLRRWQTSSDIADAVLFLSSERAAQITGQTLNVDGGYVMHW